MDGEKEIKKAYEAILDHDFEQAIEWFKQAVALNPGNADYHYKLSITYARSHKLELATVHAKRARELDGDNDEYRFHLHNLNAMELVQQAKESLRQSEDQANLAVTLLDRAIALDPLNVEGHLLLGLAYAQLKDLTKAIQSVKEVLRLDPQHEIAQKLLVDLKKELRNTLEFS